MTSILLILQFVLAVLITIVVLLQKSSSIGLGAYSGSNESLFGAKGPAGFMAKLTFALGLAFILNTLALGYFYNHEKKSTLIDQIDEKALVPDTPKSSIPAAPAVPSAPLSKPEAPQAPKAKESATPKAPVDKSRVSEPAKETKIDTK
jgi:preprotein translocase subunit SecG